MRQRDSGRLWIMLPILVAFWYCSNQARFQNDLWQHLICGRWMCQTGQLIQVDSFSHTIEGRPYVNQSWLAQILLYLLFQLGGIRLLILISACAYSAAFALIGYCCWLRSRNHVIAAICTFVVIALNIENVTIRPQVFSTVLFAGELLILWSPPRRWAPLVLGLMMLAWTNLHGIFVLGVALPWLFLAGGVIPIIRSSGWNLACRDPALRNFLACGLVTTIAAFCNPHPLHMLDYVLQTSSDAVRLNLLEWLGTNLSTLTGIVFWCSVVICLIAFNRGNQNPSLTDLLLMGFFFLMAVKAVRMVTWWSFVMAPILAAQLSTIFQKKAVLEPRSGRRALNSVVMVVLIAIFLGGIWSIRSYTPPVDEPHAMAQALKARAPLGRIFNPLEWGGYLSWEEGDRLKTFVDGRIIPYPRQVWDDYLEIINAGKNVDQILSRYKVDAVIVGKALTPRLVAPMCQSRQWSKVYEDSQAIVFQRPVEYPQKAMQLPRPEGTPK